VPGELVNYARDLVINGNRLASNAKLDQIQPRFKSLVFFILIEGDIQAYPGDNPVGHRCLVPSRVLLVPLLTITLSQTIDSLLFTLISVYFPFLAACFSLLRTRSHIPFQFNGNKALR
jgi:hypothetical protein